MYGIKEVDAATLATWMEEGGVKIVDVRTQAETMQGMIPHSRFIPLHLIPLKIPDLQGEEKLVIYCRSGARSAQACMFLEQRGLTNAYNLQGGIISWARSGLPLVAPEPGMMAG